MTKVNISNDALKDLKKIPKRIKNKLFYWRNLVQDFGIVYVRECFKGFKDHKLVGRREGQQGGFYGVRESN